MSWLGKILGGGLGFVLGGPIGAVLGAVLGHTTLDGRGGGVNFGFSRLEQKQSIYFTAVFSMLGKLAKADGVVTQQEVDLIDRVMTENFRLLIITHHLFTSSKMQGNMIDIPHLHLISFIVCLHFLSKLTGIILYCKDEAW